MAALIAGRAGADSVQPIPASAQLLAVAWLRWRIFVNSTFRRRPRTARQAVSIALAIILRIILWPFLATMVIGPVAGSGFWAWATIAHHHPQRLQTLLAGITIGWQFVAINGLSIAATASNFDPASLIRYPLRFGRYFVLRTLIGFLTPSTIVGCLSSLAAAIGIGVAMPALALPALAVLAVYALMNLFLTRMIGAWMERWLANRRFREVFNILIALFAASLQLLNFQRYAPRVPGAAHGWPLNFFQGSNASLRWLPPGYAANAILHASHAFPSLVPFCCLAMSTLLFSAVFAVRLRKQFLGEHLSEGAVHRRAARRSSRAKVAQQEAPQSTIDQPAPASTQSRRAHAMFSPVVAACLRKEWLIFRSNSAQVIGLVTPLIFVVILNHGQFATHPALFLPAAIAYVLMGALAGLYNVFGAEGLGVQVYLLAPIRMRDAIIAKNLSGLALAVTEAALAWALVVFLKRAPIPLATQVSTFFWTVFVIAANVTLGTIRSIQAPHKYVPGQARQRRGTPTNRTSGLLILLVLLGSVALQAPVIWLCRHFHQPWLAAWIFGPLAAAAIAAYGLLLHNAEKLVLSHRDVLTEELCKA